MLVLRMLVQQHAVFLLRFAIRFSLCSLLHAVRAPASKTTMVDRIVAFETLTLTSAGFISSNVKFNQRDADESEYAAPNGFVILSVNLRVKAEFGKCKYTISEWVQAGEEYMRRDEYQRSSRKLDELIAKYTDDEYNIDAKGRLEKIREEYRKRTTELKASHSRIKVKWHCKGDGTIFDQRGGRLRIDLEVTIGRVRPLSDVDAGHGRATPHVQSIGDSLSSPTTIEEGKCLRSPNGKYELVMQGDGNLVGYDLSNNHSVFWQSVTHGMGVPPYTLSMQADGDLVIHSHTYGTDERKIWRTSTQRAPGRYRLHLNNNKQIFVEDTSTGNRLWTA
eukprot:scaffold344_cov215-Prasinococcus_capsulatus_cf.AAC.2